MLALRKERLRLREGVQALTANGWPVLGSEFGSDHDLRLFSLSVSAVDSQKIHADSTLLSLDFSATGLSFKLLGRNQSLYI